MKFRQFKKDALMMIAALNGRMPDNVYFGARGDVYEVVQRWNRDDDVTFSFACAFAKRELRDAPLNLLDLRLQTIQMQAARVLGADIVDVAATKTRGQRALDVKLPPGNDADALTIRDYLKRLLSTLWDEGEGFSGKRPLGNSGWQGELIAPLVNAGLVSGSVANDDYVTNYDHDEFDAIMNEAIAAL